MQQYELNLALTTQIFEVQERINKIRNYIDDHGIARHLRDYALLVVKECLTQLGGKR